MRIAAALFLLVCAPTLTFAFMSGIPKVERDGDILLVEVKVSRSSGCQPGPTFTVEPGAPPGTDVPEDAASFVVRIHQTDAASCTRAFTTADTQLQVHVKPGAKILLLFVEEEAYGDDPKDVFQRLTFDLAKARPRKR
jgi:hypothetical protein